MKRKLLLFALAILSGYFSATAQQMDFRVVYNAATSQYEVYLKPTFTNGAFRFATGSQLTLLLPASAPNAPVTITSSLAGGPWTNNSQVYAPAAQPANDFQSIVSGGAGTFAINSGTEVEIFTFVPASCIPGIRMYTNGIDANGMSGGDWSNSLVQAITLNDYTGVPYNNAGTVCSPLASSLISFTGKLRENNALLNWAVANEDDIQYYDIERSQDASDWNQRGVVPAHQVSTNLQEYNYTDNVTGLSGNIFYRLKMADTRGQYRYSSIVKLNTGKQGNPDGNITVFPTAVRQGDDVSIRMGNINAAGAELKIYNTLGQPVKTIKITSDETVKISTAGLAAGTYLICGSVTELSLSPLSRFIVL
ncbi:hypothetical protein ACTHGU_19700 [Chitinophagaceae bacterium MMS25-I14]